MLCKILYPVATFYEFIHHLKLILDKKSYTLIDQGKI